MHRLFRVALRLRLQSLRPKPVSALSLQLRLGHSHKHEEGHLEQACWSCGRKHTCCKMFCGCGHLLPLERHCNYFKLLGLPMRFQIDEKLLEKQYLQLQKKLHPDKYTTAEQEDKRASMLNSSVINMAYQLLSSPTQRAAYLLNLHGINVLEEGRTFQDPALLSEIMELREEIEDARTAQAAENVAAKLEPYINQVSDEIQQKFETEDYHGMADAAVKLQYLVKVRDEAKHKAHTFQIQDKNQITMH